MKDDTIKYSKGYKYRLRGNYTVKIHILPLHPIQNGRAMLLSDGTLTIFSGYCWDGPSGPTIDTPDFIRGSLVHDVLYEMMRGGKLSLDYRCQADDILKEICLEDGMNPIRAAYVHEAVKAFGQSSALPSGEPPILIAPRPHNPVRVPEVGD